MSLHRVLQRLAREATEHESGTADGHAPVAEAHRVLLSLIREDEASVRAVIDMAEEFDRLRAAGQQTWNASEALLRAALGRTDAIVLGLNAEQVTAEEAASAALDAAADDLSYDEIESGGPFMVRADLDKVRAWLRARARGAT